MVNAIRDDCQQRGLRVSVICSSGIACQVYDPGVASTVRSFYGLGAADLLAELLITRASSDCRMCERVHDVDVVMWDEASMSGSRMLELVYALHHNLAVQENYDLPFGGKQLG